jgi:amidase
MEALLDSEPWNIDPGSVPIPWRRELASVPDRPLKLAFLFDDGVVRPQPPVARAMRETATKFKAAGHEGGLPSYVGKIIADSA